MNNKVFILLWVFPLYTVILAFAIQATVVGFLYMRLMGLICTGLLVMIAGGSVILFTILLKSKFFRFLLVVIYPALLVLILVAMVMSAFNGYRLLAIIGVWGTVFSAIDFKKEFKSYFKRHVYPMFIPWWREHLSIRQFKIIGANIVLTMLFAGPGALLMCSPLWNLSTFEFTVSAQQAQQTDIVFYYACGTPTEYSSRHDLINIAKEYDVTLSLAWHVDYYDDTDPGSLGYEMAEFIKVANTNGVKIEMFPCFHFNWEYILDGGYFESVDMTLNWTEYWNIFTSWLASESITIDYVLWDVEGGSGPSEIAGLNGYLPPYQLRGLAQREREMPIVRAEFEHIIAETEAMGAKTRITTWSPNDAMDGDSYMQLINGQIGYIFPDLIASGKIEYVSTMAYTNHWGDIHSDQMHGRQLVYENARMLRRIHPDKVGICIGNINGNGLTTIQEVVNEYHLAIAGGATSVRLFNGASWVNGWNYAVVGPEWGIAGTEALFEACRQGGKGTFTEYANWSFNPLSGLLFDVGLNVQKI